MGLQGSELLITDSLCNDNANSEINVDIRSTQRFSSAYFFEGVSIRITYSTRDDLAIGNEVQKPEICEVEGDGLIYLMIDSCMEGRAVQLVYWLE